MSIKTGKQGCVHAIPYDVDNPTGPDRTDRGMRTHAMKADSTGSPVSDLTNLSPYAFHIINAYMYSYVAYMITCLLVQG